VWKRGRRKLCMGLLRRPLTGALAVADHVSRRDAEPEHPRGGLPATLADQRASPALTHSAHSSWQLGALGLRAHSPLAQAVSQWLPAPAGAASGPRTGPATPACSAASFAYDAACPHVSSRPDSRGAGCVRPRTSPDAAGAACVSAASAAARRWSSAPAVAGAALGYSEAAAWSSTDAEITSPSAGRLLHGGAAGSVEVRLSSALGCAGWGARGAAGGAPTSRAVVAAGAARRAASSAAPGGVGGPAAHGSNGAPGGAASGAGEGSAPDAGAAPGAAAGGTGAPAAVLYKGVGMVPFRVLVRLKVFQLAGVAGLAIPINSFLGEARAGCFRVRPV